jgi:hypothetical protein
MGEREWKEKCGEGFRCHGWPLSGEDRVYVGRSCGVLFLTR